MFSTLLSINKAEADADIMENRQSGDSRNIVLLSYKSALCGGDKSMKVLPFPDRAHRLSWSCWSILHISFLQY